MGYGSETGCSMGPDFHDDQKTTKKNFPLKWQTKTKKVQTLLRHTKKIRKKGSQIHCHKKIFPLKWQRK